MGSLNRRVPHPHIAPSVSCVFNFAMRTAAGGEVAVGHASLLIAWVLLGPSRFPAVKVRTAGDGTGMDSNGLWAHPQIDEFGKKAQTREHEAVTGGRGPMSFPAETHRYPGRACYQIK